MEAPEASSELPKVWKTKFTSMRPTIPAIFHFLPPVAVLIAGTFGETGFVTPWPAVIMFFVSGTSFLLLVQKKQTVAWEKWTLFAVLLSMFMALMIILIYVMRFLIVTTFFLGAAVASWYEGCFPHPGLSFKEFIRLIMVNKTELGLAALELSICGQIMKILRETRKTLVH